MFSDEEKLRQVLIGKFVLQEWFKKIPQTNGKEKEEEESLGLSEDKKYHNN